MPIHVPSLNDRPEDIPLLANRFLATYWSRHRNHGQAIPHLSAAALRALTAHNWPGNVRELQNVIEHAVVLLEPGAEIRPEDIPFLTDTALPAPEPGPDDGATTDSYYAMRKRLLAMFDRQYLTQLVKLAGGNISRAARIARIDRKTLYRLRDRHGLPREFE